jgi:hypothetical protein
MVNGSSGQFGEAKRIAHSAAGRRQEAHSGNALSVKKAGRALAFLVIENGLALAYLAALAVLDRG